MKFWFGQRGWGWRLWGVSNGDKWFFGLSIKQGVRHDSESVAENEALRAEVAAWRELSDHVRVGACAAIWPDRYTDARTRDVAAALKRAERMAEALSAYQAAVNKIDDLIEYSLPMPSNTKAALYAVLADLTDALVEGSKHEQDQ